jgi:NADPH:quinone reductase-like Zn-dependent oxidoreductase
MLHLFTSMAQPVKLGGVPRKFIFEGTKPSQPLLIGVSGWMRNGSVKAVIDSVFPFLEVIPAYERVTSHKAVGKVVVEVSAE